MNRFIGKKPHNLANCPRHQESLETILIRGFRLALKNALEISHLTGVEPVKAKIRMPKDRFKEAQKRILKDPQYVNRVLRARVESASAQEPDTLMVELSREEAKKVFDKITDNDPENDPDGFGGLGDTRNFLITMAG